MVAETDATGDASAAAGLAFHPAILLPDLCPLSDAPASGTLRLPRRGYGDGHAQTNVSGQVVQKSSR